MLLPGNLSASTQQIRPKGRIQALHEALRAAHMLAHDPADSAAILCPEGSNEFTMTSHIMLAKSLVLIIAITAELDEIT